MKLKKLDCCVKSGIFLPLESNGGVHSWRLVGIDWGLLKDLDFKLPLRMRALRSVSDVEGLKVAAEGAGLEKVATGGVDFEFAF